MEELYKAYNKVFDKYTLLALYRLMNRGIFSRLGGEVATGKESKVFIAYNHEPLAVKIYRIKTRAFERLWHYLHGDPRFMAVPKKPRVVIEAWVRKEFRNLRRLYEAGVNVPRPYAFERNIVVMQFIGDEVPAPKLKDVEKTQELFWQVIEEIKKAYVIAKLVHADLSEYNILVWQNKPWIIDVGQAVDIKHPNALDFLERDVKNLLRVFKMPLSLKEEILKDITGD